MFAAVLVVAIYFKFSLTTDGNISSTIIKRDSTKGDTVVITLDFHYISHGLYPNFYL